MSKFRCLYISMAVGLLLPEISKRIDHVFEMLNNILDTFNAETKINLKIF